MGHQPELVPNFTLLIQLAIFLATYAVLRFFVFKPYVSLLHKRQEKTVGLKNRSIRLREKAEQLKVEYENFMREERKKCNALYEAERKRIGEEEKRILQEARSQAASEMQALRTQVQQEVLKVEEQFLPQVPEYASQVVTKLLGRKVTVPVISTEGLRTGKSQVLGDVR